MLLSSIHPSIHPSIPLTQPSIYLSIHPSIHLSISSIKSINPSIHPFIYFDVDILMLSVDHRLVNVLKPGSVRKINRLPTPIAFLVSSTDSHILFLWFSRSFINGLVLVWSL